MTDYEKAKAETTKLPRFSLGEEVNTPKGKGLIVAFNMPFNGLYTSPELAEAIVWYGTDKAFLEVTNYVSFTYSLVELERLNK